MKEVGGYFELEKFTGEEYYSQLISLNSARAALIYVLKAKKYSTIYLPYFLCDCVKSKVELEGFKVKQYNINSEFLPVINKTMLSRECILTVNYFGLLSNDILRRLCQKYNNVIIDNTQAFFQEPILNIDTIYSCRKYFGVPDGGYLSTNKKLEEYLEKDYSCDRMKHLLGRLEIGATEYYSDFQKNEDSFLYKSIKEMSAITHNILRAIDYEYVKKQRTQNFKYLNQNLKNLNYIKVPEIQGPFSYPFMLDGGDYIRTKLIQEHIYIPVLWHNVITNVSKDSMEYNFAKNIISIPCDQRYDEKDMQHIIDIIKSLL